MAKDIRLESFKFHFLSAIQRRLKSNPKARQALVTGLGFERLGHSIRVTMEDKLKSTRAYYEIDFRDLTFYQKGDTPRAVTRQNRSAFTMSDDPIQVKNSYLMQQWANEFLSTLDIDLVEEKRSPSKATEEIFHDDWASQEDLTAIDVIAINEAITAPELRYIHAELGDVKGKKILDVGCGLGEVSVYFAIKGAKVTATDLSNKMLEATQTLASRYGRTIKTHRASTDKIGFPEGTSFDLIYAGNFLHHVDVDSTIRELTDYLVPGGKFVSWDPLAYNPIINIYRLIATKVRTPDERPLRWQDLQLLNRHFHLVRRNYFWLTTLTIFMVMNVLQLRNPNKERYWKSVVNEANTWAWIYRPLEKLDKILLRFVPPLRLLCWNVVIFAEKD